MDYRQRLQVLIDHQNSDDELSLSHDSAVEALSPELKAAWQKLLGSIISAESAEAKVMHPLHAAFAAHPLLKQYVSGHSEDEAKHARWIRNYLKENFRFERTQTSFSSKIIYGRILPWVSHRVSEHHPVLILILVYFYEVYSQFIYEEAKKSANRFGLTSLADLIERIQKDERRHLKGIETVVEYYQKEVRAFGTKDWFLAKSALQIARVDLAQAPWAIHNREIS